MLTLREGLVLVGVLLCVQTSACQCTEPDLGQCSNVRVITDCNPEVLKSCSCTCSQLANCTNKALTCDTSYSSSDCYDSVIRDNCCLYCKSITKEYLGEDCKYGDKSTTQCQDADCSISAASELCCGTCYTGTIPSATPSTTIAPTITTSIASTIKTTATSTTPTPSTQTTSLAATPPERDDCPEKTANASNCYDTAIRDTCPQTCSSLIRSNLPLSCPYGDRAPEECLSVSRESCLNVASGRGDRCCESCFTLLASDLTCGGTIKDDEAGNCADIVNTPGGCYSTGALNQCCKSCRAAANFSLPADCMFGNKAQSCEEITDANRYAACQVLGTPEQCCGSCFGVPMTSASTTTMQPTTRRICPERDQIDNCTEHAFGVGACYDEVIEGLCCSTCKARLKPQLPPECRYGDKSSFCVSLVNNSMCETNRDTCCESCNKYSEKCPNGDKSSNCDVLIRDSTYCYSPTRESECCRTCELHINMALPNDCRYGDKNLGFCENPNCTKDHKTCCETCADWRTTTKASTTPTTKSATMSSKTSATTTSTALYTGPPTSAITRLTYLVGADLFQRDAPPGNQVLYKVVVAIEDDCAALQQSRLLVERMMCDNMAASLKSMTQCLMRSIECKPLESQNISSFTLGITIRRDINYPNMAVNRLVITDEIKNGVIPKISQENVMVTDIDECTDQYSLYAHRCDQRATCENSEGLYNCVCIADFVGNGFLCKESILTQIGWTQWTRSTPPGNENLYALDIVLEGPDYQCFTDINDPDTDRYIALQRKICLDIGRRLHSVTSCVVDDFNCDAGFRIMLYMVVKVDINYPDGDPKLQILEDIKANSAEVVNAYVADVNECTTSETLLKHSCDANSACFNSPGIYSCSCNEGHSGSGFACDSTVQAASGSNTPASLEDWTIALIVVAATLVGLAVLFAIIYCSRRPHSKPGITKRSMEVTSRPIPSYDPMVMPYYSLTSPRKQQSDANSFYFAEA